MTRKRWQPFKIDFFEKLLEGLSGSKFVSAQKPLSSREEKVERPDGLQAADLYIRLAESQRNHLNFRREMENKVTSGLWLGVGVSTWFLYGKIYIGAVGLVLYVALWLVYAILWLGRVNVLNKIDADWVVFYLRRAEAILDGESTDGVRPPVYEDQLREYRLSFVSNWMWAAQALATGALLTASWVILSRPILVPIAN